MDKMYLEAIDAAYFLLEEKKAEILSLLVRNRYRAADGWFNGHYHKNEIGEWVRESYPIPVIHVAGLCDIEIGFDKISVSAKLTRGDAVAYDYDRLSGYSFEAYGVEDYLRDFYHPGQSYEQLKTSVKNSGETEIGLSFLFPTEVDGEALIALVALLDQEGFYY